MANRKPPKIDPRKFSELLKMLKGMVPHYTPEWAASDEKDPLGTGSCNRTKPNPKPEAALKRSYEGKRVYQIFRYFSWYRSIYIS